MQAMLMTQAERGDRVAARKLEREQMEDGLYMTRKQDDFQEFAER